MLVQLNNKRMYKQILEEEGRTSSESYRTAVKDIKIADIGNYDGEGLDYDGYMELPKYIYDAVKTNSIKRIMKWLGSPVNKKKLSARYPGHLNYTLVHMAVYAKNSDLLSILLQHGADINALDANEYSPLIIATDEDGFEQAKILLEWGAEISLPRDDLQYARDRGLSVRDAFIQQTLDESGKIANLISSEFGGRRCEVINLPNHPQLNGKACVVEKYIAKKERYKIIFEGSGNAALVGPNNLKRRDRIPLDCGYYITFKNGRMSRREFATKEECQAYVASLGGDVKSTAEGLASLKL